jgi:hypothetical protein
VYLIDPQAQAVSGTNNLTVLRRKAGEAVPELAKELLAKK